MTCVHVECSPPITTLCLRYLRKLEIHWSHSIVYMGNTIVAENIEIIDISESYSPLRETFLTPSWIFKTAQE